MPSINQQHRHPDRLPDFHNIGVWLRGLMGAPTTVAANAATGTITLAANLLVNDTVTVDGTVDQFVWRPGVAELYLTSAGSAGTTVSRFVPADGVVIALGPNAKREGNGQAVPPSSVSVLGLAQWWAVPITRPRAS